MLTIDEAFTKFKSRLELTTGEQNDAASRQKRIRELMKASFAVADDFLTGSYKRHTKTKPLKDVDIFVVLAEAEKTYRDKHPDSILAAVEEILVKEFGRHRVERQRRSVRVDYGIALVDDVSDKVMSFDVTPAFLEGDHYVIPDRITGKWMATDPRIHATEATEANDAFDKQWKPLVKMIKKWNEHNGKPIKPSFLIEVMSLDILTGWAGSYPRELKAWFATAHEAIGQSWPDPAGLGEPVSDRMTDPALLSAAQAALKQAEAACTRALVLNNSGQTGAALDVWQNLFGPLFAKS